MKRQFVRDFPSLIRINGLQVEGATDTEKVLAYALHFFYFDLTYAKGLFLASEPLFRKGFRSVSSHTSIGYAASRLIALRETDDKVC